MSHPTCSSAVGNISKAFVAFFLIILSSYQASAADLIHRYSFTSDASDSIGTADGTLINGAVISGGAVVLDGGGAYVDLPNGLISTLDDISIEVWLTDNNSGTWSRIFDFGNSSGGEDNPGSGTQYVFLTPQGGPGAALRGGITVTGAGGGEQLLEWPGTRLPSGVLTHVVWTADSATETGRLYVDGEMVDENTSMSVRPSDLGVTVNNWIGRAQFSADPPLNATITEFRIYDGALTEEEVDTNHQFGPDTLALNGPVTFINEPVSQTVGELNSVTFTTSFSGTPPVSVQWQRGTTPIAGATNDAYTISSVTLADNNATFRVVLSNNISGTPHMVISSNAVLSVTPDLTPPVLVRAASLFPDGVLVEFSEGVSANTATNTGNYTITHAGGSLAVTGAQFGGDPTSVVLTTAGQDLSTFYTLEVNNVRDLANGANVIAPNSKATFAASPFVTDDIGSPSMSGSLTAVSDGYDAVAGGSGIGGTADQFTLNHRLYSGDFDLQLRLAGIEFTSAWARAGLMARSGLASNAVFAASFATAGSAGCHFASRTTPGASATMSGSLPANYPNTWLRLRRTGNLFEGFASLDGQTWQVLGSETISMPSTIEVGLALASGDNNETTTAMFRDESVGSGPVVQSISLPFEPVGPSSRRTALIISEIMYHPPDSWDETNSLEFIEIYNTGLITEDLTGHRLTGEIDFTFPDGTSIAPGQFLQVASNPGAAQSFYGVPFLGPFTNSLNNGGGTLRLRNELDGILLEVEYDDEAPWPVSPDGTGHSLVLSHPSYGENSPRAWSASDVIGGSPGAPDSLGAEPARGIVINEFLAHTDDPQVDYIELFNPGAQPVDLSGAWLGDNADADGFQISNGTVIAGRGFISFDQNQLGFALSADGEQIFLINSNRTRVLDAVAFDGQDNGVTSGRFPDGTPGFQELSSVTKGTANSAPLQRPVVINEIMYHPISDSDNDEYIELYNRSAAPVNLSQWRIQGGISYQFPSNTVIAPQGYLVVAENLTNLLAKYPHLNPANTFGNYDGVLRNSSERVALSMPEDLISTNAQGVFTTNIFYIVTDEVTYLDGGRWGQWSDGGGSSLELIDPDADNRLPTSWADSDESSKAPWTSIDVTKILENGHPGGQGIPDRFECFLHGAGEALLDDVEFRSNGGANLVSNGDFSGGLSGWIPEGTMRTSALAGGEGVGGSATLRIVATGRGDIGPNKIRRNLTSTPATGGSNTGTIRAQVRWLKGSPEVLLRVRGNWMEVSQQLNVPENCGTPGLPNSRLVSNAGPAITEATHSPILPAANEAVVVSARISDADGVNNVTLRYRTEPSGGFGYTPVNMRDDGLGGDVTPGDGVYSATISGRASGTLAAFYITATDGSAASTQFPESAPDRECLIRWGESVIAGSIGTYRIWVTSDNINFWTIRQRNANDTIDATFVYGNSRVVYNVDTMYSGSPFHSGSYNGPTGSFACDYEINFHADDKFLGAEPFVLGAEDLNLGGFWFDPSAQVDLTGTWIGRKLGQQYNYRRHVHVIVNGLHRGTIYQDTQQPNGDMLDQYFPDDEAGQLRKIEDWFEFAADGQSFSDTTATIQRYNKQDGSIDSKRYRWTWRPRVTRNPNDWFPFTNLIAAVNDTGASDYENRVQTWMDARNFLRPVAVNHIIGNWDSYGYERGKNMYAYKPDDEGWRLLLWDVELALGNGGRSATHGIYNIHDPSLSALIQNRPAFQREYLMAFQEAVDTALAPGVADTILNERYNNLRANGVPVQSPQFIINYISQRRNYLQGILPSAAFNVSGPSSISVSSNSVTLTGSAPLQVDEILINGTPYPITWTSTTSWRMLVPLVAGSNPLLITGVNRFGNQIGGASESVTVNFTGIPADPAGIVMFSEIQYSPEIEGAQFVELFNSHSEATFDLSNWRLNGLGYTFPPGSILPPQSRLVLVKDSFIFASLHPTAPPFDVFDGNLDEDGETLTLFRPGALPGEEIVVDRLRYEPAAPWPSATNGSSLQLVDTSRDNSRVANWRSTTAMPSDPPQNVIGITHTWKYYQSGDLGTAWRQPGYNDNSWPSGPALLYAEGSTLPAPKNTPLTLGQITYYFRTSFNYSGNPAGAILDISTVIDDGAVIYLNGEEIFRLGMQGGTISYGTTAGRVIGNAQYEGPFMIPATALIQGQNVVAVEVHQQDAGSSDVVFGMTLEIVPLLITPSTPGAPNSVATMLPAFPDLWLNELQAVNTAGAQDNFGQREPWVEVHNAGSSSLDLAGYYLTDTLTNLTKWAIPGGTSVPPDGFTLIWCDDETQQSAPGAPHAPFRLAPNGGIVALVRLVNSVPQIVDYLAYTNVPANWSHGDVPDAQPFYRADMFYPTPAAPNNGSSPPLNVFINEWLADNAGTLADPADGGFEDWIEIYNPGTNTVDLGGYFLTDDLLDPFQFEIPKNGHYTIPPGGYLLVWADNEPEQNSTNRADLHANFALSRAGESIGLFAGDGTMIDSVTFGAQTTDVSEGRFPDGAVNTYSMAVPTPRSANLVPNTAPYLDPISDQVVTLGQTLSFEAIAGDDDDPPQTLTFSLQGAPAGAAIHPTSGQFTWTPSIAPSTNALTVVVTDNGTPNLSGSESLTVIVLPAPIVGEFEVQGSLLIFSWPTVAGQQYRVYYKDELEEVFWNPLSGVLLGTGSPLWFTNSVGESGQRFYRVGLE